MLNDLIGSPILLVLSAVICGLLLWNALLQHQLLRVKKKLKAFFNGKNGADLEGVLFETIKRQKTAEKDIRALFESNKFIENMARAGVQKTAVVRFNPFRETGGDQSFVIALLDSADNGLLISSLYTRQGTRIYSKPIKEGKSKYPLSKEELEALRKAGIKTV